MGKGRPETDVACAVNALVGLVYVPFLLNDCPFVKGLPIGINQF